MGANWEMGRLNNQRRSLNPFILSLHLREFVFNTLARICNSFNLYTFLVLFVGNVQKMRIGKRRKYSRIEFLWYSLDNQRHLKHNEQPYVLSNKI
jgi:hypothetical protein